LSPSNWFNLVLDRLLYRGRRSVFIGSAGAANRYTRMTERSANQFGAAIGFGNGGLAFESVYEA